MSRQRDELQNRKIEFSEDISSVVSKALEEIHLKLSDSKKLAEAVLKLSDFYASAPDAGTPWTEKWAVAAYIAYYFPLNLIRSEAVVAEANRYNFFKSTQNVIDFGSGLGSGSLPLLSRFSSESKSGFQFIEISEPAQRIHKIILDNLLISPWRQGNNFQWLTRAPQKIQIAEKTLGIFSYSLTELKGFPEWTSSLDQLMIIEPSTREDGRNLMKLRAQLIEQDWQVIAPCTHQGNCPLLSQSKTDWCHDRVLWNQPAWFKDIEAYLPIKNRTLTFSYLIAFRKNAMAIASDFPFGQEVARVIGDSLPEKGKTRQLVCKDEKRQFLAWMEREGKFLTLPKGVLIQWPDQIELKSNEVRLKMNPKIL